MNKLFSASSSVTNSSRFQQWKFIVVYCFVFYTIVTGQPTETASPSASASSSATASGSATSTGTVTVSPSQTLLPHLFIQSDTTQSGDEFGSSIISMSNDGTYIITRIKGNHQQKVTLLKRVFNITYNYIRIYDFYGKDDGFGSCISMSGDASMIIITEPLGGNYSSNGITYIYQRTSESLLSNNETYTLLQILQGTIPNENRGSNCALSSDSNILTLSSPSTGRIYFYTYKTNPLYRRQRQLSPYNKENNPRELGTTVIPTYSFQPLGGIDIPITVSGSTSSWEFGFDIDICSQGLYTIISAPGISKVFVYKIDLSYQYRPQLVQVLNGQYSAAPLGSRFGTSIGISDNCKVIIIGQPGNSTIQIYDFWINQWIDVSVETFTQNNTLFPNFGAGVAINENGSRMIVGYTLPNIPNQYGIILYTLTNEHGNNGASVLTAEERIYTTGYEMNTTWSLYTSPLIVSLSREGNVFVGSNSNKNINEGEIIVQLIATPAPTATATGTATTTGTPSNSPSSTNSYIPSSASQSMIILITPKEIKPLLPFSEWALGGIILVIIVVLLLFFFMVCNRIKKFRLNLLITKNLAKQSEINSNIDKIELTIPSYPPVPGYIGKDAVHSLRRLTSKSSLRSSPTKSVPNSPSLVSNNSPGIVIEPFGSTDERPFITDIHDDDSDDSDHDYHHDEHTTNDEEKDKVMELTSSVIPNPIAIPSENNDDSSSSPRKSLSSPKKVVVGISEFKSPRITSSPGLSPMLSSASSPVRQLMVEGFVPNDSSKYSPGMPPLTLTATSSSPTNLSIRQPLSTPSSSSPTNTAGTITPSSSTTKKSRNLFANTAVASPIVENHKSVDTDLQLSTRAVSIVGGVTPGKVSRSPSSPYLSSSNGDRRTRTPLTSFTPIIKASSSLSSSASLSGTTFITDINANDTKEDNSTLSPALRKKPSFKIYRNI